MSNPATNQQKDTKKSTNEKEQEDEYMKKLCEKTLKMIEEKYVNKYIFHEEVLKRYRECVQKYFPKIEATINPVILDYIHNCEAVDISEKRDLDPSIEDIYSEVDYLCSKLNIENIFSTHDDEKIDNSQIPEIINTLDPFKISPTKLHAIGEFYLTTDFSNALDYFFLEMLKRQQRESFDILDALNNLTDNDWKDTNIANKGFLYTLCMFDEKMHKVSKVKKIIEKAALFGSVKIAKYYFAKIDKYNSSSNLRLLEAAQNPNSVTEAKYLIGRRVYKREWIDQSKNLPQPEVYFIAAAEENHVKAMCFLAELIKERNPEEAKRWLTKSADHDYPDACYQIGLIYAEGLYSTPPDWEVVKKYWGKKCTDKCFQRKDATGTKYIDVFNKELNPLFIKFKADRGLQEACKLYAKLMEKSGDLAMAALYYKEIDSPEEQLKYARMLLYGIGIDQNRKMAKEILQKIAGKKDLLSDENKNLYNTLVKSYE
ncbi:hypothetical protein TRFO_19065 [Tritrichomonas foetus]|uniref:Sel1 repeat family protein n=1 Tax=Tritrichomonas foetus TaxID=1144522 RepID=A0A1J4KJZ5_9EUKA|nr:hypothetical protein TRFO_19065 [Tritrichomonas foetus]|eukprot:OHT11434.1 hypothetical protein TRFO_19065 [Tritrichomonas foetus]